MARIPKLPSQRQQADINAKHYAHNQQLGLQRDWRKVASIVNEITNVGLAANLPPAGTGGRLYLATDTLYLYVDSGNGHWIRFGPGTQI